MTESNAQFRSVLRGYDTTQVDQRVRELTLTAETAQRKADGRSIQVSKLEASQRQLRNDIEGHAAGAHALEQARNQAAAPTYADLQGDTESAADKAVVAAIEGPGATVHPASGPAAGEGAKKDQHTSQRRTAGIKA